MPPPEASTSIVSLLVRPAGEFYDQMRYPDRLNLGPLWYGALGRLG